MMMKLLTFEEAQEMCNVKPHLLLGNGFSIAWKEGLFLYESLYDKADIKTKMPKIDELFRAFKTKDFEYIIRVLRMSARALKIYNPAAVDTIDTLIKGSSFLKETLVNTIAGNHPLNPSTITEEEYENCAAFLDHFKCIYTLNYDLLLYWVILHRNDIDFEEKQKVKYDDGFRTPEDITALYVSWEVENTQTQNIHYLHGALHLFDTRVELQKFTWKNTGITLIEQIKSELEKNNFPLFVSEGTSKEKKAVIMHSNYLSRSYRSIVSIGGALFIYGHSLDKNDDHIISLIPKSKVQDVFVSIYGDPNSDSNKIVINRAKNLIHQRKSKTPLRVHFYDASTARVWR